MSKKDEIKIKWNWKTFFIILFFGLWIWSGYEYSILEDEYYNDLAKSPFNPNIPELNSGWERTLEITINIEPNRGYTNYGLNYGSAKQVRYYIYGNIPLEVYWTKSEADCKLAFNNEDFKHYPDLSPDFEVYEYLSPEGSVVSDSSFCIKNKNSAITAKVKIIIDQKYF